VGNIRCSHHASPGISSKNVAPPEDAVKDKKGAAGNGSAGFSRGISTTFVLYLVFGELALQTLLQFLDLLPDLSLAISGSKENIIRVFQLVFPFTFHAIEAD
jgi:hypothetical protein